MRKLSPGLTLAELLVVIAVIAALAAILYPVIHGARKRGQNAQIVSNMRQLAQAVNVYMDDYCLRLPPLDPRPLLKNPAVRAIAYYPHKMATRSEMDSAPREEVPFLGDYVYCREVIGPSVGYVVFDHWPDFWRDPDAVWNHYWTGVPASPVILVSLHDAGFHMLPRQKPLWAVFDTKYDDPPPPPWLRFPPRVLRCRLDTSVRTYRILRHMQTNMVFSYLPLCRNRFVCCRTCEEAGQYCSEQPPTTSGRSPPVCSVAPGDLVLVMAGCEACERAVGALTRGGVPFIAVRRCSEAAGPPCFADAALDTAYPTFLVLDESGRIERISAGWPSGATADEAVEYYRRCTQ